MDFIRKINLEDAKLNIIKKAGSILKNYPYVVYHKILYLKYDCVYYVNVVEFQMVQWREHNRVQFKSINYEFRDSKFQKIKGNPTIGNILRDNMVDNEFFFCNKKGLTQILKRHDLEREWILFKLTGD